MALSLFVLASAVLLASPFSFVSASLTDVELTSRNSSTLTLQIDFDSTPESGSTLVVVVQPENDNATESRFTSLTDPMEMVVSSLNADTAYTFYFTFDTTGNSTAASSYGPVTFHTTTTGPQIIGFYASNPTDDSEATDLSTGDLLTITFDADTNELDVGSTSAIDAVLSFSQLIGTSYTGKWSSASTLVITISDAGESAPSLGYLIATVIGQLKSSDGTSDVSTSVSPPLVGSWAGSNVARAYFQPTDPDNSDEVISDPNYSSYLIDTTINTAVTLPMSLTFPSSASSSGYMVSATVVYPRDVAQVGFTLDGDDFSYTPSTNIGSTNGTSNSKLKAMVPTVALTPKTGYTGYACVSYQLYDVEDSTYTLISSAYTVVKVTSTTTVSVPVLTTSSDSESDESKYKIPLIIAICSTFGAALLIVLGVIGYRKYRRHRDASDYEGRSLTSGDSLGDSAGRGEAGPTRRFYYDAKV